VTGVEVTLDAVAPDGSYIHIGRVTCDATGTFSYLWTPPNEGKYTIIATFEGSNSYGPSYATTAVGVTAAPSPSATAEQAGTLQNTVEALKSTVEALQPLTTALLVLVIIAILMSVVNLYALRKRK
jgi:hypothetical protein